MTTGDGIFWAGFFLGLFFFATNMSLSIIGHIANKSIKANYDEDRLQKLERMIYE